MKQKLMTNPQALHIRTVAVSKNFTADVGHTKLLPLMPRILDAVQSGQRIITAPPLVAPPGARIHVLKKVKTQLDQPWQDAVNAAGPNTPDSYNVWKVGDLYLSTGMGVVEDDLILLNYPNGDGSFDKALAWGEQYRLRKTDPRRVFAAGNDHPRFNYEVGPNPSYIVATEACTFVGNQLACRVWWNDSERKASLLGVEHYGYAHDWFAFRE